MGGMIFNEELGKGVKKRFIPASQLVTFPTNASYNLVIQKSREFFFSDEGTENYDYFTLADSGGLPYDVGKKSDWILSEFIQGLKQPPSKLRIYIMYQPKEYTVGDHHVFVGIMSFYLFYQRTGH